MEGRDMKNVFKYFILASSCVALTACGSSDSEVPEVKPPQKINIETYPIKQTGQIKSYDENGTEVTSIKDDGYYHKGDTPSYTRDDAKEIVTDHITKLEWQDDKNVSTVAKNWKDAQIYCNNLKLYGDDWKLPTRKELVSLSNYGQKDPAIDSVFKNIVSTSYWTSTSYAEITEEIDDAWYVDFTEHGQFKQNKIEISHVCCVRKEKS